MTPNRLAANLGSALALILLAACPSAWADDFDDNNDLGWEHVSPLANYGAPGTFTVANGQYRIQAPASPDAAQLGPGRAASLAGDTTLEAFQIQVDLVNWNNNLNQAFGILARTREPGLGTLDAYALTYVTEAGAPDASLQLLRITDEREADGTLATQTILLNPSVGYRLVFIGLSNQLTGSLYALSDLNTPLVTLFANDVNYTTGGCGLFVYDNSGFNSTDITFDNFLASPPPAKLEANLIGSRTFTLAWPEWGGSFALQWRANAAAGNWNNVSGPFTISNGLIRHTTNAASSSRIYRLYYNSP